MVWQKCVSVCPSCVFCSSLLWNCQWAAWDSRQMGKGGAVCRGHVNSTSQQIPIRCSGAWEDFVVTEGGKKNNPSNWHSKKKKNQTAVLNVHTMHTVFVDPAEVGYFLMLQHDLWLYFSDGLIATKPCLLTWIWIHFHFICKAPNHNRSHL